MAQFAAVAVSHLDSGLVLAPERYDPRRTTKALDGIPLGEIAEVIRDQVYATSCDKDRRYMVLDTGDAQEGVIRVSKPPVNRDGIGSAKKRLQPNDVIVSRLRPYLRQVAYVDPGLFKFDGERVDLLCSTEFFVLRSKGEPIAFLVPYLLSDPVQRVLAAAQEGGHHPRFCQATLRGLVVPDSMYRQRKAISERVLRAVALHRESESDRRELVSSCNGTLVTSG
jgi:hypothetical protein